MKKKKRSFAIMGAAIVILIIAVGLVYFIGRMNSKKPPRVQEIDVSDGYDDKEDGRSSTEEAENMIKLAQYYIGKEEFDLARNQLENVLIKDPVNKLALSLLENVIRKRKELEKKEEEREDEKLDRVVSTLKDSLPRQKEIIKETTKETTVTDKPSNFDDEIKARNKKAEKFFTEGMKDYESADYAGAIKNFEKTLDLNTDNPLAYSMLGASYYADDSTSRNNIKKAIDSSKKALSLDSTLSLPHYTLAQVYDQQDLISSAMSEYKKALELDPNNGMAYYKLGVIQYLRRNYREAQVSFTKASEILVDFPQAYYNLGLTAQKLGKTRIATSAYARAIEVKPDYTKAIINLGLLYYENNFFDLVFTSGVLIHLAPDDINGALKEIYRSSKRYIYGYEYFAEKYTEIVYRGKKRALWKTNFTQLYLKTFNDLKIVKEKKYTYQSNKNLIDISFLLEKKQEIVY
ncbi:hypothetical protein LCGC14_1849140 [marine sediment metagenome]|uniref:UDP-N-acetylglucosamine--peptide N-acetylglucosaminyltransferase SPINDLY n=1 Tax=marine sediment metagenome TaxID=412755 RepID=A0A0F9GZ61_9ZZZZ